MHRVSSRPFLRPLLAWTCLIPLLTAAILLGFLLAPILGRRRAFWGLAPSALRAAERLFGVETRLEGWEALPADIREGRQSAIFIANHASLFDPPLIVRVLPCRPVFIAKKELAWVPFLGWVIWLAGFIFIDRRNRHKAIGSLQRAALRIQNGQSIAAFPEGTRTRTGALLPFKKGIFILAWDAGVPVVPLAIQGGFRLLPRGEWRAAQGPYTLRVDAPLHPHDFEDADQFRLACEATFHRLLPEDQQGFQSLA